MVFPALMNLNRGFINADLTWHPLYILFSGCFLKKSMVPPEVKGLLTPRTDRIEVLSPLWFYQLWWSQPVMIVNKKTKYTYIYIHIWYHIILYYIIWYYINLYHMTLYILFYWSLSHDKTKQNVDNLIDSDLVLSRLSHHDLWATIWLQPHNWP